MTCNEMQTELCAALWMSGFNGPVVWCDTAAAFWWCMQDRISDKTPTQVNSAAMLKCHPSVL